MTGHRNGDDRWSELPRDEKILTRGDDPSVAGRALSGPLAAGWTLDAVASLDPEGVWIVNDAAGRGVSYPDEARNSLASLEDDSVWFRSRNILIRAVIDRFAGRVDLVEVGAGNGCVAAYLARHGFETVAIEPSHSGARNAAARGVTVSIAGHLEDLQLPNDSIPAFGLFDVIEHLEDPAPLLEEVHRALRPGGSCIVTVPASNALWSQADEFAGHFRRYGRKSLDLTLVSAGLERAFSSYCFVSAVPLVYFLRTRPYRRGHRLSRLEMEQALENELAGPGRCASWLALGAARCEAWWFRRSRLPFGTSILAVYRKR